MTREQVKHYLLSVDTIKFIIWHNDYVCDPYGETFYSLIRVNEEKDIKDTLFGLFSIESLTAMFEGNEYSETDKYVIIFPNGLFSFNTISDLLNSSFGEYIIDTFLQDEEEHKKLLNA